MSKRLLTLALAAAMLASACSTLPQGTVTSGEGVRFIAYVADGFDNAGLGNQVTIDSKGVPYLSYLIFPTDPPPLIPITRPIGSPYITSAPEGDTPSQNGAAVGVASLADDGIWTRGAAAQSRDTPPGIVVPFGPATVDSLVGSTPKNTNGTGIAIDANGGFHVVWTGDDGVYYAEAPSTGGFQVEQIFKNDSTVDVVGPMSRPSVAVDADGAPWVAYSVLRNDHVDVNVATKANDKWTTATVATMDACNGCPPPLIPRIGVTPEGPIVAWVDPASKSVMAARLKDGAWTAGSVESNVSAEGLGLTVGKDGTVFLTFYAEGAVMLASSVAEGWTTTKVADATPPKPSGDQLAASNPCVKPSESPTPAPAATPGESPSPPPSGSASPSPTASPTPSPTPSPPLTYPTAGNCEPTTGVAVDDQGNLYVAWSDGDSGAVLLSSSTDGSAFAAVATPDTQGGAFPSLAVRPDGSQVYLAWYGSSKEDMRLGVHGNTESLAVAAPSPTSSVAPPSSGPACGEDGKVALNETAQGTAFKDACLVAPAGKDFSIVFDNLDPVGSTGPHNIAVTTDQAGADFLFKGADVDGPKKVTYDVTKDSGTLKAGTYFFHCTIHPIMTGTLAVVKVK